MAADAKGLLFVYSEPGDIVDEDAYTGTFSFLLDPPFVPRTNYYLLDWYDNEHAPARLKLPGFYTAARYKATDSQIPQYLALYDTETPEAATSPEHQKLMEEGSDTERQIMPELEMLQVRKYEQVSYWDPERVGQSSAEPGREVPGRYLLVVDVSVEGEGAEKDLNDFYEMENMEGVSRIPGWARGRRYQLVDKLEMGRNAKKDGKGLRRSPMPMKFLTIHEFNQPGFFESEAMKQLTDTPRFERFEETARGLQLRLFGLHKEYRRQGR
ncbi:hypothetical protein AX16_000607 [Volvariella volvacea WC 439]|nr:hypothetical protein AX16_000607 [Volvariella volvacea WC 439]